MATHLIRNSPSPVAVVQRRQLHTAWSPDRWVVALLEAMPGEDRVLRGAVGEGRLRGAAVMALSVEASSVLRETNCSILVLPDGDAGPTGDR